MKKGCLKLLWLVSLVIGGALLISACGTDCTQPQNYYLQQCYGYARPYYAAPGYYPGAYPYPAPYH